jgi:hypothetical protein
MELDITKFFYGACMSEYSASAQEIGCNAGQITWEFAMNDADQWALLDTPEKLAAFQDFAKGFGAWSDAELGAMSPQELNALCIQFIAGDIREAGFDNVRNSTDKHWQAYQQRAEKGELAGRLYRAASAPGKRRRVVYSLAN